MEVQIQEKIGTLTIQRDSLNDQISLLGEFVKGNGNFGGNGVTKTRIKRKKARRKRVVSDVTAEVGIFDFLKKKPGSFSGQIVSFVHDKHGHTKLTLRSTITKMVKAKKVKATGKDGQKKYALSAKALKG